MAKKPRPMVWDVKKQKKAERLAENQKTLCKIGSHWNHPSRPSQYIGKPGGTGAGKSLAIPTLPVMRSSVIG